MSVVARTSLAEGCQVLAKGSPEMMLTIMKKNSIPRNYNDILKEYASHGFRVLAIASKPITEEELRTFSRDDMETGLIFNGFEVF
jgi:cation-transporting P-type ATPase 13A2